ncbi:hypothetical protein CGLO_14066 [Colletotrichum gloeosporioides Cg-14]|uniref:Uncharacterized protein n=1 Tax=Colletotrichum gloeosporioides (strain Cg-14) TaxID=1237896 RepID=T0K4K4_COLGC|nr:hypothetical protein CGLO_14066 [Colletotrichum gloeosporioides Cg-14]
MPLGSSDDCPRHIGAASST